MWGLLPHFFVFDFFGNFHFDSMKSLLEVLLFFPLLNLGGKFFEKKSFGWPSRDLKSAVVNPTINLITNLVKFTCYFFEFSKKRKNIVPVHRFA